MQNVDLCDGGNSSAVANITIDTVAMLSSKIIVTYSTPFRYGFLEFSSFRFVNNADVSIIGFKLKIRFSNLYFPNFVHVLSTE